MEKPKCRLCGKRHYSNEPHIFETEQLTAANKEDIAANKPPKAANKAANTKDIAANVAANELDDEMVTVPRYMLKSRYKDAEKRREYMKEFMRNVRKNKKAGICEGGTGES